MTTNKDEFSLYVMSEIAKSEDFTALEVLERCRTEFGYERKQVKKLLTNNLINIIKDECEKAHLLDKTTNQNVLDFFG